MEGVGAFVLKKYVMRDDAYLVRRCRSNQFSHFGRHGRMGEMSPKHYNKTSSITRDMSLHKLGFSTDNGAFYYIFIVQCTTSISVESSSSSGSIGSAGKVLF